MPFSKVKCKFCPEEFDVRAIWSHEKLCEQIPQNLKHLSPHRKKRWLDRQRGVSPPKNAITCTLEGCGATFDSEQGLHIHTAYCKQRPPHARTTYLPKLAANQRSNHTDKHNRAAGSRDWVEQATGHLPPVPAKHHIPTTSLEAKAFQVEAPENNGVEGRLLVTFSFNEEDVLNLLLKSKIEQIERHLVVGRKPE